MHAYELMDAQIKVVSTDGCIRKLVSTISTGDQKTRGT